MHYSKIVFLKKIQVYLSLDLIFALQITAHGSKKINPQILDLFFYLAGYYYYFVHRVQAIFLDRTSRRSHLLCFGHGYHVKLVSFVCKE